MCELNNGSKSQETEGGEVSPLYPTSLPRSPNGLTLPYFRRSRPVGNRSVSLQSHADEQNNAADPQCGEKPFVGG